jgi:secreted trypsin-like serine protease
MGEGEGFHLPHAYGKLNQENEVFMHFQKIISILMLGLISQAAHAVEYPEFENAVLIKSVLTNGNVGFCSGVVLNPTTVLTAAHCIDRNTQHRIQIVKKFFIQWTYAVQPAMKSSSYHPELSKSDADIGILTFTKPLPFMSIPLCQKTHANETLYRVGFGGRNGKNLKNTFEIQAKSITDNGAQKALDEQSVSGDSGGPVFAVEGTRACLYAIHSSLGLELSPKVTYNPIIRRTSLPVALE